MTTKSKAFSPTQRLQREYEQGMRRILGRVLAPKRREETFDQWVQRIAERSREPDIQSASEFLARQMVQWTNKTNARTWREAAARTNQGRRLHVLLIREMQQGPVGSRISQLVRENAQLISSIPLVAAQKLVEEVTKAQQEGARASTVAKMMSARFPELLTSRVHLISRTETAKASLALTESRCEELNIQWYEWLTSEDGDRVRPSHRNMAHVIVPWSQPPDPDALDGGKPAGHYHAGGTYNCRCSQAPILTLEDIKFPARIYWQGRVSQMTKQQFKSIAVGLESRAA